MRQKIWMTVFGVDGITHPDFDAEIENWEKYRYTFAGGHEFVEQYLKQFSTKETSVDFERRKEITYCPAHAKAAVIDIKNAIYQRLVDVKRENGPENFMVACKGEDNGVDFDGNSMTSFIGRLILPELLSMAKVGVYIDKDMLPEDAAKTDVKGIRPYIYMYEAESIRSWTYSRQGVLQSLLLKDTDDDIDEATGLVKGTKEAYRHLRLMEDGVHLQFYTSTGVADGEEIILNLKAIPFVLFELTHSLLIDVADYQIALLQLASSDIHYSWKSNYPFYIEQFDMASEMFNLKSAVASTTTAGVTTPAGTAAAATQGKGNTIDLGTRQGRRYPKGVDAPAFIHPSAEPLLASMKKQDQMQEEIRKLVNLSLMSVEGRKSAESKQEDTKSLEAGLSYIGLELEYGERAISRIWNEYENYNDVTIIKYPTNYSLKTDSDRRTECKELREELPKIPSKTYQKEMAKKIVTISIGHEVDSSILKTIHKEIEASKVVVTDPEIIIKDHEAGFVSTQTASELRGYPIGEADQAKKDHAERLARIAAAQSDPQSRGLPDASGDPAAGGTEKKKAGMRDPMDNPEDNTRGEGK